MTCHNFLLVGLLLAACSSSSLPGTGDPKGGTGGSLGAGGVGTGGMLGECVMAHCYDGHWGAGPCGPNGFAPLPGHVQCDLAKSGVECVTSGVCPLLDGGVTDVAAAEVAPRITADGGINSCNNTCAADEICVAYYDGTCTSMGASCRKVSASCRESVIVQGAACFERPCNDDICGLKDGRHFWACNYAPCPGDTLRADAKCYGP
jgi:hypothetical protein